MDRPAHWTRSREEDHVFLAVAAILCATFTWALGDTVIKMVSNGLPLWQMFALRSLLSVPILIAFLRLGARSVPLFPVAPGWTALRSLMLAAMWLIYYIALPNVPISVAAAMYYTSALFITILSPFLTGERVGILGFLAVFVGFTGVFWVAQPETGAFDAWAILPLISAILYALAMLLTRTKCRAEHPFILVLTMNFAFIVSGVIAMFVVAAWPLSDEERQINQFLWGSWKILGISEWLVLALLSVTLTIAALCSSTAYQLGAPSLVSTFDFSYVIFAGMWGIIFLSEIPTTNAITGTVLIIAAGILTVSNKNETASTNDDEEQHKQEAGASSGSKVIKAQPTIEVTIGQARIVIRGAVDQDTLTAVLKVLKKQA